MMFHIFAQAAALLEKAAGDLMRLKLGQVPPGETVLVCLELTMELQNQSGRLGRKGRGRLLCFFCGVIERRKIVGNRHVQEVNQYDLEMAFITYRSTMIIHQFMP